MKKIINFVVTMGCLKLTYQPTMQVLHTYELTPSREAKSVQSWLRVDPLADNTPNVSPYAYCVQNPVRLIDPDGRDWFENEKTGAVYYNNKMGKDDAGTGAMKGEGWKHMGENGMFTNGDKYSRNTDIAIVLRNGGTTSFTTNADGSVNDFNMQLMFEGGGEAEEFMSGQGYDKKPLVANIHTYENARSIAEPNGPQWLTDQHEDVEKVFSWTYGKKESEGSFDVLSQYKRTQLDVSVSTSSYTRQTWEKRKYDYKTNSWKPGTWTKVAIEVLKNLKDIYDATKK